MNDIQKAFFTKALPTAVNITTLSPPATTSTATSTLTATVTRKTAKALA